MVYCVDDLLLFIVKGVGLECVYEIFIELLQMLGGLGFLVDYFFEQYICDVKIDFFYEGIMVIQVLDFFFCKIVCDYGKVL